MSDAHGIARDQLRAFIERIERLEEEKKTIADDIKDVYGEAKSMGFDAKILRKVISIRKQDADERMETGSDSRHLSAGAGHDPCRRSRGRSLTTQQKARRRTDLAGFLCLGGKRRFSLC